MARRTWDQLSQEQRDRLTRDGISAAEWNTGAEPIGPPSEPPDDDDTEFSDAIDDPDNLDDAVSDPDGHEGFWRGHSGERLSRREHERLADESLRNIERQVGDIPKYSHEAVAERMERMTPEQLRLLGVMNQDQIQSMARWAAERFKNRGEFAYTWLLYH